MIVNMEGVGGLRAGAVSATFFLVVWGRRRRVILIPALMLPTLSMASSACN